MRAILILLLVSNLAFFGYHYFFVVKNEPASQVKVAEVSVKGKGLQLLAEQADASMLQAKVKPEMKARAPLVDDEKPEAEFCTMIGPYSQLLQAEYAAERLASLGVVAHIVPIEIKEGESYWVYLRPEVSEREALRRLYELQKKNIESYVITRGELTNGISFGRFANYADAEAQFNEIKRLGYSVDIKMLPKTIIETWVVIDSGFAEKIDESVWLSLLDKEPTLEKRQNFCLGVASQ